LSKNCSIEYDACGETTIWRGGTGSTSRPSHANIQAGSACSNPIMALMQHISSLAFFCAHKSNSLDLGYLVVTSTATGRFGWQRGNSRRTYKILVSYLPDTGSVGTYLSAPECAFCVSSGMAMRSIYPDGQLWIKSYVGIGPLFTASNCGNKTSLTMTQFVYVSSFYLDGWSASEHVVLKLTGYGTMTTVSHRVDLIAWLFLLSCSNPHG
jgi:hypothetical protein